MSSSWFREMVYTTCYAVVSPQNHAVRPGVVGSPEAGAAVLDRQHDEQATDDHPQREGGGKCAQGVDHWRRGVRLQDLQLQRQAAMTKIEPITIPGLQSGTMTCQSVCHAVTALSPAALSKARSIRIMALKIGTIMNSVYKWI